MSLSLPNISSLDKENQSISRRGFIFSFERNKVDFSNAGYNKLVKKILVREDDCGIDQLEVSLYNPRNRLLLDRFFATKSIISVALGYSTTGMSFHGDYILHNPEYSISDASSVLIRGYSGLIKFATEEKRRSFSGLTHSDIVKKIALENGFVSLQLSEIEDTKIRYSQVTQANENDFVFIRRLASLNGYQFFIDNSNFIHFHPLRSSHLGIAIAYKKGEGLIRKAKIRVISHGKHSDFISTSINPKTGEIIVSSGESVPNSSTNISSNFVTPVSQISEKRLRFLVGVGHEKSFLELQQITNAAVSASSNIIEITCETIGLQEIYPRKLIAIDGLTRFSGVYYIKSVEHYWDAQSGYTTVFKGYRTYTGLFLDSMPLEENSPDVDRDVTSKNRVVGIASIG